MQQDTKILLQLRAAFVQKRLEAGPVSRERAPDLGRELHMSVTAFHGPSDAKIVFILSTLHRATYAMKSG
jgi:hypothetical protein